jgi:hypothetical protein
MNLADRLDVALTRGSEALDDLRGRRPADRADRFRTLLTIYDLHTADVASLGERGRLANHPTVATLKWELEGDWLAELEAGAAPDDAASAAEATDVDALVGAMRTLAARDRLPEAYEWVARDASWDDLVWFLAVEGGPDGGFDDLVAACQVGLSGEAKLELARNYWDEMGNGSLEAVHTVLHQRLVEAIEMPRIPRAELSEAGLERAALGGLLMTNHWLQPEMIGALGLIELQAGPRCRKVLAGLERVSAPDDASPFYAEHAEVDPRHGQDWLCNAISPLVAQRPEWGPRMLQGAQWRSRVNAAFFTEIAEQVARRDRREDRSAA